MSVLFFVEMSIKIDLVNRIVIELEKLTIRMGDNNMEKKNNNLVWFSLPTLFVIVTHLLFMTNLKDLVIVFLVMGYPLATICYTAISVYREKRLVGVVTGLLLAASFCLLGPLSIAFQFWLVFDGICFVATYVTGQMMKRCYKWYRQKYLYGMEMRQPE